MSIMSIELLIAKHTIPLIGVDIIRMFVAPCVIQLLVVEQFCCSRYPQKSPNYGQAQRINWHQQGHIE